jgi:hypothetical protein
VPSPEFYPHQPFYPPPPPLPPMDDWLLGNWCQRGRRALGVGVMHDLGGAHGLHLESLFIFASVATLELFVLNSVLHSYLCFISCIDLICGLNSNLACNLW